MAGRLQRLLHDRWQGPLILLATGLTILAIHRLKPPPPQASVADLRARIEQLGAAGDLEAAANSASNLLARSDLTTQDRATLHLLMADLLAGALHKPGGNLRENRQKLLSNMEAALAHDARLSPSQMLTYAQAMALEERFADSANWYRRLSDNPAETELARHARTSLARLLTDHAELAKPGELPHLIEQVLHDDAAEPEALWWALQQAMHGAIQQADWSRGHDLLASHRDRFSTADIQNHFDYLEALLLAEEGRTAEAQPLIDAVEARLHERVPTVESRTFGHLPAMARLLRGRIHLIDDQPQAAMDAFIEARAMDPQGAGWRALVGEGQALAGLERHEDALTLLTQAAAPIVSAGQDSADAAWLRQVLQDLHARNSVNGANVQALQYMRLAATLPCEKEMRLPLLERLGEAELAAAAVAQGPEQRAHYAAAGAALAEAAQLAAAGSEHHASLLWNAAQQFDAAGQTTQLRAMLRELLEQGNSDPRRPAALLQMGQSFEAVGAYAQAIAQYDKLAQEYPQLEEAARGQLLKAGCLAALGAEHFEQAEQTLVALLESPSLSPQATVFHDALLNLADILYQQGRYTDAIGRFETFLARYPGDVEEPRAQFLLADAYRLNAYELALPEAPQADPHRLQEARNRFRNAVQRYRAVREQFFAEPASEAHRLYRLLSLMGEADCLAELNEPETLATAVARYRQVAAENERTPVALVAQVQLARLHLRQDSVVDAARAIERCRWLIQGISDEAFASNVDGLTRQDWERYFSTIATSPLFQNAFSTE